MSVCPCYFESQLNTGAFKVAGVQGSAYPVDNVLLVKVDKVDPNRKEARRIGNPI